MVKRLLSICVVALAAVLCLSVPAWAETIGEGVTVNDIAWSVDSDGTLSISGYGSIPNYGQYGYSEDFAPWIEFGDSIKRVVISEGISKIGNYAFCSCHNLEDVQLPSTMTSVGGAAFAFCTSLKELSFPAKTSSFGAYCFRNCTALEKLSILANGAQIGTDAYLDTPALKSGRFCGADWCLDGDVLTISGVGTFSPGYGSSYSVPPFPWGEESSSITAVVVKEGVNVIGSYSFWKMAKLSSVSLPSTLTSIGGDTFVGCASLKRLDIPKSVTSIGGDAFEGCTALVSGTVFGMSWSISEGTLTIEGSGSIFSDYHRYDYLPWHGAEEKVVHVVMDDRITNIPSHMFYYMPVLTSVHLPENVISIDKGAFGGCSLQSEMNIPMTLESIGSDNSGLFPGYAYGTAGSSCLYFLSRNNDVFVTGKGEMTKFGLTGSLSSITFSEKITQISDGLLDEAANILSSGPAGVSCYYYLTRDGVLMIEGSGATKSWSLDNPAPWFGDARAIRTVVIGRRISSVGSCAFFGCTQLIGFDLSQATMLSVVCKNRLADLDYSIEAMKVVTPTLNYNGSKQIPSVVVYNGKGKAVGSAAYTLEVRNGVNAGNATAYVRAASPYSGSLSAAYTIEKVTPTITFSKRTVIVEIGSADFVNKVFSNSDGGYYYHSSNPKVATVGDDGTVHVVGVGRADISACLYEAANYWGTGKYYTVVVTEKISPKATKIKSVKKSKKKLVVKWKKATGSFSGYVFQISTSKKFSKSKTITLNVSKSKTSITAGNPKKGKTYYVRIRVVKKQSGKKYYSAWSAVRKL